MKKTNHGTVFTMIIILFIVACNKKNDDKTKNLALGAAALNASRNTGTAAVAPTSLTYTGSPFSYTKNTAITTLTPTVAPTSAVLTSCSANPALPAGLAISATTCAISGTPTVASAAADYTITAVNTAGNTTTTINIFVEGTTWIQEAYLKAPNAEANDAFGNNNASVAVSSNTIAWSAISESSNQTPSPTGRLPVRIILQIIPVQCMCSGSSRWIKKTA